MTVTMLMSIQYGFTQGITSPVYRWLDSINKITQDITTLQRHSIIDDSSTKEKLSEAFKIDTPRVFKPSIQLPTVKFSTPKKPVIDFTGGFVSYNWNYRSSIDTPFQENNLSQHLISANLNFTIVQSIPITISYFDRQSNSKYFKDYRDISDRIYSAPIDESKSC